MKLIAHRGNISGPNIEQENRPDHILNALNLEFDVEVDVWLIDDQFFLGHDCPQYKIDASFLLKGGIWCHAKNIDVLDRMIELGAHCFWHEEDDVTLTSRGYMWTYPGKKLTKKSICVMPEWDDNESDVVPECAGICSDYPEKYRVKFLHGERQ